jgi:hypothetical protein
MPNCNSYLPENKSTNVTSDLEMYGIGFQILIVKMSMHKILLRVSD